MKKILMMLLALMAFTLNSASAKDNDDWGLACSLEEFQKLEFGELMVSSSSTSIVASSIVNTAQVDHKNKTIKVWVLYTLTPYGRQQYIDKIGSSYNSYGYTKQLKHVNLKTNNSEIMSYVNFNCDGSVIDSVNKPLGKDTIVPGSIDETLINDLRKKFKI